MQKMTSLLEPDAFENDWYGWVTNQVSHIGLGVGLTFFISVVFFLMFGEMPYKVSVLSLIAAGYIAYELGVQGWQGADTVEDSVFVVGYGSSGALAAFSEMSIGSSLLSVDLIALLPFFVVAVCHVAAGALFRRTSKKLF